MGGGWDGVVGVSGKSLPLGCKSGAVPSVGDRYVHNPLDGSRRTLSAV